MEHIANRILAVTLRVLAQIVYLRDWHRLRIRASEVINSARNDRRPEQVQLLFDALVLAEDRRFYLHSGVDLRAIVRAIVAILSGKPIQGGSTITQQLVRNLTNNYARNIQRKYKEILLAVLLDAEFDKQDLLRAYLKIAYFGWRMNGVVQAIGRQRFVFPLTTKDAAQLIARLKYPEPEFGSPALKEKIQRRADYIEQLMNKANLKPHD